MRAEHAGDEKLRRWKPLSQHGHERNRSAHAHRHALTAEATLRGLLHGALEPRLERRRIPAGAGRSRRERDARPVGRIGLERTTDGGLRRGGIRRRRQTKRELHAEPWREHVAGVADCRQAVDSCHRERGSPRGILEQHRRVAGDRLRACGERHARGHRVAEQPRRRGDLPPPLFRRFYLERLELDLARILVGEPRQERAHDVEARGGNPAARARMNSLGQYLDGERADDVSSQRRRDPQPLVVARLGVEAHHQARRPDPRRKRLDVRRQILTAALLARLDQDHTARVRNLLRLEGGDCRQGGEHGVAVVRAAPAVKFAVANHGLPGAQARLPPGELRLLIEVTVEKDRLAASRDLDEEQRRTAFEARDLDRHTRDGLAAAPVREQLHGALHVPVLLPLRIEQRRFVRDPHVLAKLRHDGSIPDLAHEPLELGRVADLAHGVDSRLGGPAGVAARVTPTPYRYTF